MKIETKNHNWNWNPKLKHKFQPKIGVQFFLVKKSKQICVEPTFQFCFWVSIWFLWFRWNQIWNPKTELKQKSETETSEIRISIPSNVICWEKVNINNDQMRSVFSLGLSTEANWQILFIAQPITTVECFENCKFFDYQLEKDASIIICLLAVNSLV
jgi:hypothetical protein